MQGSNQLTGSVPALAGMAMLSVFSAPNNHLAGSLPAVRHRSLLLCSALLSALP